MIKIEELSLTDLKLIHLLNEEKNLTRVAEKLFLSQPAASQKIKLIRERLNIDFAVLDGKKWQITDEGLILSDLYSAIEKLIQEAKDKVGDLHESPTGHMIVGTSDTLGIHLLPKPIAIFKKIYPNIRIEITSKPSRSIAEEVLTGKLELGIALESAVSDIFVSQPLLQRTDCLVTSPSHRLTKRKRITKKDMNELPLVVLDRTSQSREIIEDYYAKEKLSINIAMEMGSIEMIKTYVMQDFGTAIVPKLSVKQECKAKRLRQFDLPADYPSQKIVVFSVKEKYHKTITRLFIKFIVDYFKDQHDH